MEQQDLVLRQTDFNYVVAASSIDIVESHIVLRPFVVNQPGITTLVNFASV